MDVGYGNKKRVHLEVAGHSRDWRLIGCEDDGDNCHTIRQLILFVH